MSIQHVNLIKERDRRTPVHALMCFSCGGRRRGRTSARPPLEMDLKDTNERSMSQKLLELGRKHDKTRHGGFGRVAVASYIPAAAFGEPSGSHTLEQVKELARRRFGFKGFLHGAFYKG